MYVLNTNASVNQYEELLSKYLNIKVKKPIKGEKLKLLNMACDNAKKAFDEACLPYTDDDLEKGAQILKTYNTRYYPRDYEVTSDEIFERILREGLLRALSMATRRMRRAIARNVRVRNGPLGREA